MLAHLFEPFSMRKSIKNRTFLRSWFRCRFWLSSGAFFKRSVYRWRSWGKVIFDTEPCVFQHFLLEDLCKIDVRSEAKHFTNQLKNYWKIYQKSFKNLSPNQSFFEPVWRRLATSILDRSGLDFGSILESKMGPKSTKYRYNSLLIFGLIFESILGPFWVRFWVQFMGCLGHS